MGVQRVAAVSGRGAHERHGGWLVNSAQELVVQSRLAECLGDPATFVGTGEVRG